MNNRQRIYALNRLRDLETLLQSHIRKKYTTHAVILPWAEKLKLIRTGKVKLREHLKRDDGYIYLRDAFDFSQFESDEKFNEQAYNLEIKKLADEFIAAKDSVLFIDGIDFLNLIQSLETKWTR